MLPHGEQRWLMPGERVEQLSARAGET